MQAWNAKRKIAEQARRVKVGVRYERSNYYEKARMRKNESGDTCAHWLEILAWKMFVNEGININKELMKKFIVSMPRSVSEVINITRKEKMRWTSARLLWEDILELVEDKVFKGNERSKGDKDYLS